jgi:Fe-S-cluster containining protein
VSEIDSVMNEYLPVDHPRFRRAQKAIFTRRVVADCMQHQCVMVADEGVPLAAPRPLLEACCQYGADVDLRERDAIMEHAAQIGALLTPGAREAPWFTDEVQDDPDYPSGQHVRTATFEGGCVFLSHDRRGCAIHRSALEAGWDFHQVKPHICRLFPLSYEDDAFCLSDDFVDYDCADRAGAPSVYRVARETIAAVFGPELVAALDATEALAGATPPADASAPLPAPADRLISIRPRA